MLNELDEPALVEVIEKAMNIGIKNVVHLLLHERIGQRVQRLVRAAPRTKTIREAEKVVRINDVGRAEAIDYRNFQYCPQEAENKYYLSRWAELYFGRNLLTIERDQMNALYFLNGDVQRAVIDQERKDNVIPSYVRDSGLPFVDVEVKNVVLDDLRQSPYSARIEFEKVFTNLADHSEVKRERWTATVTYVFAKT